jgi:hypothetical protein
MKYNKAYHPPHLIERSVSSLREVKRRGNPEILNLLEFEHRIAASPCSSQ